MKQVGDVAVYSSEETGIGDVVIERILGLLPDPQTDFELANEHHAVHLVRMFWKRAGSGLKAPWERTREEREVSEILRGPSVLETIRDSAPRVSTGEVQNCPMQINRYRVGDSLPWHEHATPNSFRNIKYVVLVPLSDADPAGPPCLFFKDALQQEYSVPTNIGDVLVFPATSLHRVEVNRVRIVASINLPGYPEL